MKTKVKWNEKSKPKEGHYGLQLSKEIVTYYGLQVVMVQYIYIDIDMCHSITKLCSNKIKHKATILHPCTSLSHIKPPFFTPALHSAI